MMSAPKSALEIPTKIGCTAYTPASPSDPALTRERIRTWRRGGEGQGQGGQNKNGNESG